MFLNFIYRNYLLIFYLSIFIISIFSINALIPIECLFRGAPVYDDDYSMHYYHCLVAKEFLLSFGKTWGYDPFLLSGYPAGVLYAADNKAWEFLFFLSSFIFSEGFAFNLYIILFLLIYPFLVYAAAINFKLAKQEAVVAAILSILVFNMTFAIDFVSWGMISFVFASFFSIYVFSLFFKWLDSFSIKQYCILMITASVLMLMHIISPVSVIVPSLVLCCLYLPNMRAKHHLLLFALPVVVILMNSFWLLPVAEFYHQGIFPIFIGEYSPLQTHSLIAPLKVYLLQYMIFPFRPLPELNNTFIESLLALFAIAGFYLMSKSKLKIKPAVAIFSGALFMFCISYFGSYTDFFAKLHPMRFIIPLNIYMIIPASIGIYCLLKKLVDIKAIKLKLFLVCLVFLMIMPPVFKQLRTIYYDRVYLLNCSIPEPVNELFSWINKNTDNQGRILVEDSEFDSGHQYYGTHLPALFPHFTGRQYLVGPNPYPIVHQAIASFTSGLLFNRDVSSFTVEELIMYFDLYNIKWIICWSEESIKHFNQYPDYFIPKTLIDKFHIYEIQRKPSFFIKGEGEIECDFNRLSFNNIKAEDGEIVIKYHWMDRLKAEPFVRIEEFPVLDHPVGFIKVFDPPSSFEIVMEY